PAGSGSFSPRSTPRLRLPSLSSSLRHPPPCIVLRLPLFFFHGAPPTPLYTLSLHDALPILFAAAGGLNGLGQLVTTGSFDVAALALSLAQLVASFWMLSLVFRQDVSAWFKHQAASER